MEERSNGDHADAPVAGPSHLRTRGGSFCIAPGCANEFYRVKESGKKVHFHKIPVKRPQLLRRWLAALKRLSPPVGEGLRVCSDHFLSSDYVLEGVFEEDGRFVQRPTNRLMPDAVPSVFDFSGYSAGETDRPAQVAPASPALRRRERARRRAGNVKQQEVDYVIESTL